MRLQKLFIKSWHMLVERATAYRLVSLVCSLSVISGISSLAQTSFNVTDFGAQGDAVQLYVNTVINSTVLNTTNVFSTADIGKAIEVFGCGNVTTAPNCQDLIATITDVVNGTNVYISQAAQSTLTGTFATYGHENSANFQAAIDAASGGISNIVNIPAGQYLFLTSPHLGTYGYASLFLHSGGIHLIGAGMTNTVLLSQGAWTIKGADAWRGFLFVINPPTTNDYPLSFENLTLDGGVPQGNTSNHNFPASTIDGSGWDETHDAIVVWSIFTGANTFTDQTWTNVMFSHWRGEMVKSLDQSANGNLAINNCIFNDGNATAINIYATLDINGSIFSNLFQVGEYYQQYSTNTSYFRNSFVTNITGNGFALNGAKGSNPQFIIQSNIFYFASGQNGIMTMPGDNISIISNLFVYPYNSYGIAINLGAPGYQGTFINSNIVIQGNSFIEPIVAIEIGGGSTPTDPKRVESVQIYNNIISHTGPGSFSILQTYGWSANIQFFSNNIISSGGPLSFSSGSYGSLYASVDANNNNYYTSILTDDYNSHSVNNLISYGKGSRYLLCSSDSPGTSYSFSDVADASQIPSGAQIMVTNGTLNAATVPIYLDAALTRQVLLPPSGVLIAKWTGTQWSTNLVQSLNTLTVTSGSGSGTYASGQVVIVIAQTMPGKIFKAWSGATSILANPSSATTTATIPAGDSSITATYNPGPPSNLHPLN